MDDKLTLWTIIIGGGGIASGIATLWKLRREGPSVEIDSSKGAVVVLKEVLDELKEENQRLRARCDEHEQIIKDKDRTIKSLEHIITIIDDRHSDRRSDETP